MVPRCWLFLQKKRYTDNWKFRNSPLDTALHATYSGDWGDPGIKSQPGITCTERQLKNYKSPGPHISTSILFPRGVVACTFLFIVLPVNRFVATPAVAGQPVVVVHNLAIC